MNIICFISCVLISMDSVLIYIYIHDINCYVVITQVIPYVVFS